jgi:hypothetical protein
LPWSQSDIDALKAAIAEGKGARQITFADQTIVFHSITEMLELLAAMQNDVAAAGESTSSVRYAATSKGI